MTEPQSNVRWLDRNRDFVASGDASTAPDAGRREPIAQLGRAARSSWSIAMAIVAACLALSILASLLMPESYRATTRIEFTGMTAAASNADNTLEEFSRLQAYRDMQIELLRTPSLAQSVAAELDIADADGLLDQLTISPVGDTALVDVAIDDPEPQAAAVIANGWIRQFIIVSRERRGRATAEERSNLETRMGESRTELAEAEQELADFAAQHGLLAETDDTQAGTDETLGQQLLVDELEQASADLASVTAARIAAESARSAGAAAVRERAGADIAALRRRRGDIELQVAQLSSRFGEAYPPLAGLREEIAEIDTRIADSEAASTEELEADYRAALSAEQMLQERVEDLRERLVGQREDSLQYNILRREVEERRAVYDGMLARYRETALAETGGDPVSVVEPASVPSSPHAPNRWLNLVIGIVAGLVLAMGWVFAASRRRAQSPV